MVDKQRRDDLLGLLQIEAQHRQRIDSIWAQYKDAMLTIHGMIFAVLGALVAGPELSAAQRKAVVIATIVIELGILLRARIDVEKSAAEVQADYAADYKAVTGFDPPRPLYSRALKMRKVSWRTGDALLPEATDVIEVA
ncbi:hypothetical protein [Sphingomonas sp. 8AM]|uniref:hypothetical protein n=1 Tax=Sphingomonas sp. 8AM TaxID=2653170 RepID=UPI0012F0B354|nr:hypothetical protein [Sphingomonas sp. 8AM]VXC76005.1 hypothetical protein SPHINGO8AM_200015 [Sphingomonas sp. 8AM]